jgi:colicin import membrane protein
MKTASIISACLHAAVLLFAMLSFAGREFETAQVASMPVDIISDKDFSQMTKGVKQAPKLDMPKPFVEEIGNTKPAEDAQAPVTKKKEIQPTAEKTAQPDSAQPDPIADKIKKEEKKEQQQTTEKQQPLPPKKPVEKKQPKFEPDKIAALLDKRDPQRNAATGNEINNQQSLGHAKGQDTQLSQSEIDALRARLRECWNPPVGAMDAANLYVIYRVLMKKDGSVQDIVLVGGPPSQLGPALAESARRALLQCQPYKMLKAEHYDQWKDLEIKFDPKEMFGG